MVSRSTLLVTVLVVAVGGCAPGGIAASGTSTDGTGTDAGTGAETGEASGSGDTDTEGTDTGGEVFPLTLELELEPIKQFVFRWTAVEGALAYQLYEEPRPGAGYSQLGEDTTQLQARATMPLHLRYGARYFVRACDAGDCVDSNVVEISDPMLAAIGYFKADAPGEDDLLGYGLAMSADGTVLVAGARREDGEGGGRSGAVYVYVRDPRTDAWSTAARLVAEHADAFDVFGVDVAIDATGTTIVVGAEDEDGGGSGLGGDPADDSVDDSGAAYVFVREPQTQQWTQAVYLKATGPAMFEGFGASVATSADGGTVVVGAPRSPGGGRVLVFVHDPQTRSWSLQAELRGDNTDPEDQFGADLVVSADGDTLVVGAPHESSANGGVDPDGSDNSLDWPGAAYVFERDPMTQAWAQRAYLKASIPGNQDLFGRSLALDADASTLAIGAYTRSGPATQAGAVYVFARDPMTRAWAQVEVLEAIDPYVGYRFGYSVALSAAGDVLAVGGTGDNGGSVGLGGDPSEETVASVGSVQVFIREAPTDPFSWRAYVKGAASDERDYFGLSVALSGDGQILAVAAQNEDGADGGIGGDPSDDSRTDAGAVFVY